MVQGFVKSVLLGFAAATLVAPAVGAQEVVQPLPNPAAADLTDALQRLLSAQALLAELNEPIMSSTLILPGDDLPMTDSEEIAIRLKNDVDIVVDAGSCGIEPTTVVDLTGSYPVVLRQGKGLADNFE